MTEYERINERTHDFDENVCHPRRHQQQPHRWVDCPRYASSGTSRINSVESAERSPIFSSAPVYRNHCPFHRISQRYLMKVPYSATQTEIRVPRKLRWNSFSFRLVLSASRKLPGDRLVWLNFQQTSAPAWSRNQRRWSAPAFALPLHELNRAVCAGVRVFEYRRSVSRFAHAVEYASVASGGG